MAKSKKLKKSVKRKKKYPPLSKQDKFLYACIEILGAIVLLIVVYVYEVLAPVFIFKKSDVLAFEERWTVILLFPAVCVWLIFILKSAYIKIPIIGNKKIDYYNTVNYKFILPLFDKRYKNNENYEKGRKKFFKKFIICFCVFTILLSIGVMGCIGRHEFNANGIVTYSILNNKLAEYSYDDVESYIVSADTYYINRARSLSYRVYDVNLVVKLSNGDSFTASYNMSRDIYALEKIDSQLKDKNKTVNSYHLQAFIGKYEFSDDELKVLYKLFEE